MVSPNSFAQKKSPVVPSLTRWLEQSLVAMPARGRFGLKTPQELAFGFTDDRKTEKGNQDRVAIAYCLDPLHIGDPWFFAGVCDGVGGEARGEVAASVAMSEILSELCTNRSKSPDNLLSNAILRAHDAVRQYVRGSATTFAGVFVSARGTMAIGSVGDSRIYSASEEGIRQLSQDDTLEDMLRRQAPGVNEAQLREALMGMNQRWKDSLGQAIGSDLPLQPRIQSWPNASEIGGCILCTDGVWKTIEAVLDQVVIASGDRRDLARRILNLTESLRASDNATAVVLPEIKNIVEWLREKNSSSEHGLVHLVLPTESIVAPWMLFEERAPTSTTAQQSAISEQPSQTQKTPTKPKRKPKRPKNPAPEQDANVQLTIEEEIRDDKTDAATTISKEQ